MPTVAPRAIGHSDKFCVWSSFSFTASLPVQYYSSLALHAKIGGDKIGASVARVQGPSQAATGSQAMDSWRLSKKFSCFPQRMCSSPLWQLISCHGVEVWVHRLCWLELSVGPSPIGREPPGADTRTYTRAHTHTHCGTIHKNLPHRFWKHICEGQIRWYYHWRRLAVAKAWQTFYTKTTQSTRWHFSYENFEQKMWDPLKRESADGPDTNGKACQRNCVVATAANFSKCSSGKL